MAPGRSCRLGNDHGVLCRIRNSARTEARPSAGGHRHPDSSRDDVAGHDGALSDPVNVPAKEGDTALVHAAAGGAGLLITQLAKNVGARVFGTVSTQAKAKLAKEAGADEVILYTEQDFEAETKRLTNNKGVDVVYDSVGVTTFEKSLNSLRPRGRSSSFGQSSGPVPPFDPGHTEPERIPLPHSADPRALRSYARGIDLAL